MSAAVIAAPLPSTLLADRAGPIATASTDPDGYQEFVASGRRHTL